MKQDLGRVRASEPLTMCFAFTSLVALSFMCGCGSDKHTSDGASIGVTPIGAASAPAGACDAVTETFQVTAYTHVTDCGPLDEPFKPPVGGNHYGHWAQFQTYAFPVAYGFLIHAMEHGAVIFWYNCPEGCDSEVAEAQALIDSEPVDALCTASSASVLRRAILVPDPALDVRWAASAWGVNLRAKCFDPAAFGDFYTAHYGMGREDLCADGLTFTASPCQ